MNPTINPKDVSKSSNNNRFEKWKMSFRPTFLNVLWYLFLAFGAGVVVTRIVGLVQGWTQH